MNGWQLGPLLLLGLMPLLAGLLVRGRLRALAASSENDLSPRFASLALALGLGGSGLVALGAAAAGLDWPLWEGVAATSAAGLLLALLLRGPLSDVVAGFFLALDPPFRVGDHISLELPSGLRTADVLAFGLFRSRLAARSDGALLLLPHRTLAGLVVRNHTLHGEPLQRDVEVRLALDADLPQALLVVAGAAKAAEGVVEESVRAELASLTGGGLLLRVRFAVLEPRNARAVTSRVRELLVRELAAHQLPLA